MTALSRSFLDLSRQRHLVFSRSRSLKIPSIDDRSKVQKVEGKSAKESTTREKDKNAQKDNEVNVRVCIIGGGVTPLYTAVLLKQYGIIKSIRLVDTRGSTSEALTDVSHLETSPRIDYFRKRDIKQALREVIKSLGNYQLHKKLSMNLSK